MERNHHVLEFLQEVYLRHEGLYNVLLPKGNILLWSELFHRQNKTEIPFQSYVPRQQEVIVTCGDQGRIF